MNKRFRRDLDDDDNLDRWLLTYADLITLLLAFFIVMYSMSQLDAKKFGKMTEALTGVLRGGESILNEQTDHTKTGHGLLNIGDLSMIQRHVEERFKSLNEELEIATEVTERGLVVHVMESALFRPGSADLHPKARKVLDIVADFARPLPNHIRVEGHTDDTPINTRIYPSNWELSSARATEVVRYLIDEHGIPADRISALGYGQFRPVAPNNTAENRARNRRVDIVVLTMELTLTEPSSSLYDMTAQK
ncbi:OmpA family protein [candidate division GN15 bacterium]|nr:OmpA family protein [candidate division GN15 bacterium]